MLIFVLHGVILALRELILALRELILALRELILALRELILVLRELILALRELILVLCELIFALRELILCCASSFGAARIDLVEPISTSCPEVFPGAGACAGLLSTGSSRGADLDELISRS